MRPRHHCAPKQANVRTDAAQRVEAWTEMGNALARREIARDDGDLCDGAAGPGGPGDDLRFKSKMPGAAADRFHQLQRISAHAALAVDYPRAAFEADEEIRQ